MELDWYGRATADMMSHSPRPALWSSNVSSQDTERQVSRWSALLSLIQYCGIFSSRSLEDERTSQRSSMLSSKVSPAPPNVQGTQLSSHYGPSHSREGAIPSKSHVCFACVFHHHDPHG